MNTTQATPISTIFPAFEQIKSDAFELAEANNISTTLLFVMLRDFCDRQLLTPTD